MSGAAQLPQLAMRLPHPSPAAPQLKPCCAHVSGVQMFPPSSALVLPPHWLKPPPPQNSVPVQLPQLMMLPQPSLLKPQLKPSCAHVFDTHVPPSVKPLLPPH